MQSATPYTPAAVGASVPGYWSNLFVHDVWMQEQGIPIHRGLGTTGVRTRETIETVGGAPVISAGATVVAAGEDGTPRPLTDPEREALQR